MDRAVGSVRDHAGTHPLARPVARVVLQQRQRLFREGISQLLAAEADVAVVAVATTASELLGTCQDHHPGIALIEADVSDRDSLRLVNTLRRSLPHMAIIGLASSPITRQQVVTARRAGMTALISRQAGFAGILTAIRESTNPLAAARPSLINRSTRSSLSPSTVLTERELEILSLVGAGLSSKGVSHRLHISSKTVENHKQRIFAKLGVQNQAHAVSVAMRTGLMRPDRVIGMAVAD